MKAEDKIHFLRSRGSLLTGALLSIIFWLIETVTHTYFLKTDGAFLENLFPSEANELWMRFIIVAIIMAFSWYAHGVMMKRARAEEILRKTKELYETLAESAPDLISITDRDLKARYVNEYAAKFFGKKKEEIIGRPFTEIFPGHDVSAFQRNIERVFMQKNTVFVEDHLRAGREGYYFDTSLVPLFDKKGDVEGVLGISMDVTARKKMENDLREEKDKAEKYFEIAAVIMLILGQDGRVARINRKGCEILGYGEGELIGRDWFETVIPCEERQKVKDSFRHIISGDPERKEYYENTVVTKDDRRRLIAWHNTVIMDEKGVVTGTLSSGEDITERRKAEQELGGRIDELERFRKVTVEREIRIRELKERVFELEARERLLQKKVSN